MAAGPSWSTIPESRPSSTTFRKVVAVMTLKSVMDSADAGGSGGQKKCCVQVEAVPAVVLAGCLLPQSWREHLLNDFLLSGP